MSVRLIIDSASDISNAEAQKLGICMIPMLINIADEEFLDGVELSPKQFYEKLVESDALPKTSQINEYRFSEVFERELKSYDELIVISISSKLSGTYASAVRAAEKFNGKVFVVDSLSATVGERLLAQHALHLLKEGKSAKETVDVLNVVKKNLRIMAMVGTLEYLKKGGRISSAVAFAGELLSIKPVIAVVEGEVKLVGKAMGSKKANNLLNKLVQESGGIDFSMPFGAIYSGLNDALLQKYIADSAALWKNHADNVPIYPVGGTIGTHVGPGAIGVAFFKN